MDPQITLVTLKKIAHRPTEVLARSFREKGPKTTVVYTGEEGLTRLGQERADAVLRDVRLPKMNGIEVLRRIRSGSRMF